MVLSKKGKSIVQDVTEEINQDIAASDTNEIITDCMYLKQVYISD